MSYTTSSSVSDIIAGLQNMTGMNALADVKSALESKDIAVGGSPTTFNDIISAIDDIVIFQPTKYAQVRAAAYSIGGLASYVAMRADSIWFDEQNNDNLIVLTANGGSVGIRIYNSSSGALIATLPSPPNVPYYASFVRSVGNSIFIMSYPSTTCYIYKYTHDGSYSGGTWSTLISSSQLIGTRGTTGLYYGAVPLLDTSGGNTDGCLWMIDVAYNATYVYVAAVNPTNGVVVARFSTGLLITDNNAEWVFYDKFNDYILVTGGSNRVYRFKRDGTAVSYFTVESMSYSKGVDELGHYYFNSSTWLEKTVISSGANIIRAGIYSLAYPQSIAITPDGMCTAEGYDSENSRLVTVYVNPDGSTGWTAVTETNSSYIARVSKGGRRACGVGNVGFRYGGSAYPSTLIRPTAGTYTVISKDGSPIKYKASGTPIDTTAWSSINSGQTLAVTSTMIFQQLSNIIFLS